MKRILATLCFFTRLPFWRLAQIDKKYYERVVPLWPLAGWLTGGIMALVFYISSQVFPLSISVILAIISRILITGALHEDGFADFCDGFGGGSGKERILEIMKDSHIGTYGVLGLVVYYLLFFTTLIEILNAIDYNRQIPSPEGAVSNNMIFVLLLVSVDTLAKYLSSTIIYFLPYARKEAEAKNKLIYVKTPFREKVLSIVLGLLPIFISAFLPLANDSKNLVLYLCVLICSILPATIMLSLLFLWMKKCIKGYTGDCCGASFIITEITIYLSILCTLSL